MSLSNLKAEIAKMRDADKTYQYIGDKYGVNKGVIYRILHNDYEPKDPEIRKRLGLDDVLIDFVRQVRNSKTGTFVKES